MQIIAWLNKEDFAYDKLGVGTGWGTAVHYIRDNSGDSIHSKSFSFNWSTQGFDLKSTAKSAVASDASSVYSTTVLDSEILFLD